MGRVFDSRIGNRLKKGRIRRTCGADTLVRSTLRLLLRALFVHIPLNGMLHKLASAAKG